MYFENFSLSIFCTKSEKNNPAKIYKVSAPIEIDIVVANVPIHLPNRIPDIIKIGEAKPNMKTQIIQNTKK